MSNGRKIAIALIASLLLHAVIFFSFGLYGWLHGETDSKPLENLKLVEVSIATPTPKPIQILPMRPLYSPPVIDSQDLQPTDKAPKNPVFESDKNLAAGSTQPATGRIPLPSQEGKERRDLAFNTQRHSAGPGEGSVAAPPVMELAPAPAVQPKPRSQSTPMPLRTPPPVSTPAPTPLATPQPTPQPTPQIQPTPAATPAPTPAQVEDPIFKPTPVPSQTAAPTPDLVRPTPVPAPQQEEKVAMLSTPRPNTPARVPQQPGYHPDTEQNKIMGSLSNRGKAGVEALGTPKGRYQKMISDAIGGLWYPFFDEKSDLITAGTVSIRFYINQRGQVEDPQIISNSSNEALADCSMRAIIKAKFLPPPSELAPSLENGRYEVEFSFTENPFQ